MLAKLALRNVKRQLSSYLIYFITVVITVALIFAVNNTIFSSQLQDKVSSIKELKSGLVGISIILSLIVAFVLGYATKFMLKLRKREFGTYLTLGMTRGNLLKIFILETLIMFAAALLIGIVLGLFLFQGLMALVMKLMELEIAFSAYSLQGLIFTISIVVGIFFLSSLTSAIYLKRVKIYDLIHGEKRVDKNVKHPFIWLTVAIVSLECIIALIIVFNNEIKAIAYNEASNSMILLSVFFIAVFIILLHYSAAKSIIALLLRSKKICAKDTNIFTLRQLNGKLKSNSIMVGFLAFLISFAVIGANVSFAQKITIDKSLELEYPFDICANLNADDDYKYGFPEADEIIKQYVKIEREIPFKVYDGQNNFLHSFTRFSGSDYESIRDMFISESDYNALMRLKGWETIDLNGQYAILQNAFSLQDNFKDATLQLNGNSYTYQKTIEKSIYIVYYTYFLAIVSDEAIGNLPVYSDCKAYDLAGDKFDAAGLVKALSYERKFAFSTMEVCDFRVREDGRLYMNANMAIFVLAALYIAIVFVFMALALIALKTLSEIDEDKRKYSILYRLGVSNKMQGKALFAQIFSFFLLPFLIPILLSIPTGIIINNMMIVGGFTGQAPLIALISGMVCLVITAIYMLYFTATYFIAKKNIVCLPPR